jgi:hypothetical protein
VAAGGQVNIGEQQVNVTPVDSIDTTG